MARAARGSRTASGSQRAPSRWTSAASAPDRGHQCHGTGSVHDDGPADALQRGRPPPMTRAFCPGLTAADCRPFDAFDPGTNEGPPGESCGWRGLGDLPRAPPEPHVPLSFRARSADTAPADSATPGAVAGSVGSSANGRWGSDGLRAACFGKGSRPVRVLAVYSETRRGRWDWLRPW